VLTAWLPEISPGGAKGSLTALFGHLGGAQLGHASFHQVSQLKGESDLPGDTYYI
jgi:hypothetical protein